jgi:dihydrofolate synthase/folylpolyglutamate synthase
VDPRDELDDLRGPLDDARGQAESDDEDDDDLGPDGGDDQETDDLDDPDGHLRGAVGDPRGPMAPDDEEDGGLGPAFDLVGDDVEEQLEAIPLTDDEADDILTRYLAIEAALVRRWPESRIEPSLDRISALVDLLGDPHRAVPVIHLAGTNGKSSTARMIESVLRSLGLRTGLFTSPHLHNVRERIQIDGEPVDLERFVTVHDDIAPYVQIADRSSVKAGGPPLSFFEVVTGLAFATFADAPVDVVILEAGMGGSWDATNVADAAVAVVTPIALDHMDYLGSTLEAIAGEKAGIIKPGSSVVLAAQELPVAEVLLRRCVETGATAAREGVEFGVDDRAPAIGGQLLTLRGPAGVYPEVFLPLFGAHQAANASIAVAAAEAFLGGGGTALNPDLVRAGFAAVTSPGRLEVVRRSPTVVVDAAHNPHGARALAAAISDSFEFASLVGVVAVLADKDARGLLEALEPVLAEVVITRSSSPRATDVDSLAAIAVEVFGADRVEVSPRLADALDTAMARADEAAAELGGGTGVLVTGSVVTVAEARALLGHGEV